MLNVVPIYYYCCCWSVVNECETNKKKLKFRYVFLPKEEGCSSSSLTTSSLVNNFCFDDAGCFRVPVDVGFFLGLFGGGGWGMLSLLASFTAGVVAVCGSSYWLLSSSATFVLTTAS